MTSELEKKLRLALAGRSSGSGVMDFAKSGSALRKAKAVVDVFSAQSELFPSPAYLSLGGADGGEAVEWLRSTGQRHAIVVEYDDSLADLARKRSDELQASGVELRIITGDVVQKLDQALELVGSWQANGVISSLVVSIHALLHELPDRGSKSNDLVSFLSRFTTLKMPVLMVVREPCAPRDLPEEVYLSANCSIESLLALSQRIRGAHVEFMNAPPPVPVKHAVRMPRALAAETIVKLFYIESLDYEIDERVTSLPRDELVELFCRVFGGEQVRHTDMQSDSFDRLWNENGLRITDAGLKEYPRPQLHVRIVARYFPSEDSVETPEHEREERGSSIPAPESKGAGATDRSEPPSESNISFVNRSLGAPAQGLIVFTSLPDLLTPSRSLAPLHRFLLARSDQLTADTVVALGRQAVSAVEEGDFAAHVDIGDRLVLAAGDIAPLRSAGIYFKGEGLRLLADLSANRSRRLALLREAEENYRHALELEPTSVRSTRGLARVLEVKDEPSRAVVLFERSKGMALQALNSGDSGAPSPLLMHELLRVTRHHVNCILDIRAKSVRNAWNRADKTAELEGYLVESENRHREYLRRFEFQRTWHQIEWFMALVFFAKAWYELGQPFRADQHAIDALRVRRRMIDGSAVLSLTESMNLRWWAETVVSGSGRGAFRPLVRLADAVAQAVGDSDTPQALKCVDEVLRLSKPLWSR